jgi:hypothetical protein
MRTMEPIKAVKAKLTNTVINTNNSSRSIPYSS